MCFIHKTQIITANFLDYCPKIDVTISVLLKKGDMKMKKIKTVVAGLIAATVIFACSVTCFADANPWRIGDCNGDGYVNVADLVTLKTYLKNNYGKYKSTMDVNGDGRVDDLDYDMLYRMLIRG